MRQNETTGAPVRSEPKLGNACAYLPSAKAAADSSSAAVTTPWPPRPWIRTSNTGLPPLGGLVGAPLAATPQRSLIRPAATAASGYRQIRRPDTQPHRACGPSCW